MTAPRNSAEATTWKISPPAPKGAGIFLPKLKKGVAMFSILC